MKVATAIVYGMPFAMLCGLGLRLNPNIAIPTLLVIQALALVYVMWQSKGRP